MRWLIAGLLVLFHTVGFSAPLLMWPDNPDGRLYRIDVQKEILEVETEPLVWHTLGAIQLKDVIIGDFPPVTRVTCLNIDNRRFCYMLIDCTQQVYRFDRQTRTLERLDKTFYRGYNCYSAKFLRKDTLYSFGGYGFWHTNNILTYYKAINHEWESLNPAANAPRAIHHGFNGYLSENDSFFSALSFYQNDSENKGAFVRDDSVYAYSFTKKTWDYLGAITSTTSQQLQSDLIQKGSWFQVGRYFVLKHYETPQAVFLIVDPIRNEVRIWKDVHKLLANLSDNYENEILRSYVWNDALYFRRDVTGSTGKLLRTVRLPINDLWKNGQFIGAFYEPVNREGHRWLYGLLAAFLVLSIGTLLYVFKKPTKTGSPLVVPAPLAPTYPTSLTVKERDVFSALSKTSPTEGMTTEQLNDILQIGDKAPENQRKIRADVIKGLNLKLQLEWGISEAVERVPTALDQRMFTYALKSEVLNRVQAK